MSKIPEFSEDLNIISALGDAPGTDDNLSTAGLKAKFDLAGNLLKKFLNSHVVPAINGHIASNEGMLSREGGQMNGAIDMFGNKIKHLPLPEEDGDAVSKEFVETIYDPEIKRYVDGLCIATAEHRRSGTLHVLTAPVGCGNLKFVASAPFADGDTITLNGKTIVAKTQDGEALTGGAWATGAVVMCLVSPDGGTLFFRGGGGSNKSQIIVTAPTGSTVTCSNGTVTKTATEQSGKWTFKGCDLGTWEIRATLSGQSVTEMVVIQENDQKLRYNINIVFRITPEFTYTGDYAIVDDSDQPIEDFVNWKSSWKIRFLTSGDLHFTNLHGWNGKLDVFLVGGAGSGASGSGDSDVGYPSGGGGGGGYTKTKKEIQIVVGTIYHITIGAGGVADQNPTSNNTAGSPGGNTTAFDVTANGGGGALKGARKGGNGGSGGNGGVDGSDGTDGTIGKGQGTTTREFEESSAKIYASGGKLSTAEPADINGGEDGAENTGDGGGGGGGTYAKSYPGGNGGSGIAIIRNTRAA